MPKSKYNSSHKKGYDVEKALNEQAARIVRIRQADAAAAKEKEQRKANSQITKLKKSIKRILKGRHSPAGKRYLAAQKGKKR